MINERMQELINVISNGNKRAFSKLVGVTPTVIENIVGTRQGKPGYELLEKIAFSIENINLDWLLTGRGNMFYTEQPKLTVEPIKQAAPTANESAYYTMYKEKDAKVEILLKENGVLEERIRQMEAISKEDAVVLDDAKNASSKKRSSPSTTGAGSMAALSENP